MAAGGGFYALPLMPMKPVMPIRHHRQYLTPACTRSDPRAGTQVRGRELPAWRIAGH